jgi:hypothetical protein
MNNYADNPDSYADSSEHAKENGDMIQFRWRSVQHYTDDNGQPRPCPPVLEYRLHFMPSMFRPLVSDVIVLKEIPEDMKRWVEVPTK